MAVGRGLVAVIGAMVCGVAAQPQSRTAVVGVWESERCIQQERNGARTSSKSVFIFLEREWALELIQYADGQCAQPTMKVFVTGPYQITERSSVVAGATDATFGFSYKAVTFYADPLLAEANRGVCGDRMWEPGQPQEVSATGCLWVTPTSACPKEFDLVKVEGHRLFLGERPQPGQDLCREDRRARTLRPVPLIRR